MRVGQVRQLNSVVSEGWEERIGLDIDIAYYQTIEQELAPVDAVEITLHTGPLTETLEIAR